MDPVPSPYDILPPPGIAYTPTIWVWVITLLLGFGLAGLTWILLRFANRKRALQIDPLTETLRMVDRTSRAKTLSKSEITALVLTVKRYLSSTTGVELVTRTGNELKVETQNMNEVTRSLLELVYSLDELTFRPTLNLESAVTLIKQLREKLSALTTSEFTFD